MGDIKMVDLRKQYLRIKSEVDHAIENVLASTSFIQGPQVKEFAESLGAYTHAKHVIPCGNGTDALQIAMMALGLRPGDEVIVPVHTYVATAEVIALLGLSPVFVDVDPRTFNIDVSRLEELITPKTRAIVPVHLYGQCADMRPLLEIAERHNLYVIEDAAQSLGAIYRGFGDERSAGTMGTIGTTSFFPSKNLGAFGDGGAIFTNDPELADKCRMIANHGQRKKYHHDVVGINSRLDTLQAAILSVKLRYLPEYEARRRAVADYYDQHLNRELVITPFRAEYSTHVFHQYTVQVRERSRDEFQQYLASNGIPSMIYYPVPLYLQPAYRLPGTGEGQFPVTEKLSKTVISLPIHTEMDAEQLEYICNTINRF